MVIDHKIIGRRFKGVKFLIRARIVLLLTVKYNVFFLTLDYKLEIKLKAMGKRSITKTKIRNTPE